MQGCNNMIYAFAAKRWNYIKKTKWFILGCNSNRSISGQISGKKKSCTKTFDINREEKSKMTMPTCPLIKKNTNTFSHLRYSHHQLEFPHPIHHPLHYPLPENISDKMLLLMSFLSWIRLKSSSRLNLKIKLKCSLLLLLLVLQQQLTELAQAPAPYYKLSSSRLQQLEPTSPEMPIK